MAKKPIHNFSEAFFLERGYTKNAFGGYDPPPIKSDYIRSKQGAIGFVNKVVHPRLVTKEKVVETPNFIVKSVTEWFIQGYSVPSKKNSRQNFVKNGKQISIPSKAHALYVKMTDMQYKVFGNEFKRSVELLGLTYPLRVEFTFIRSTKHSFDYCNACQTCEDIMKGHWIPDDSADYIIPSFQPYQYDKNNPGVRIKLLLK